MNIQFITPFSRGFSRMKRALFQPFDLKKWFVIGFTAWLAGLMDNSGGGNGGGKGDIDSFGDVLDLPYRAWEWLTENPAWFLLAGAIIFFVFFLIIVFSWLSSRGKFMFVDNIVRERALIAQPWRDYAKEGNSLFVWRLGFTIICLVIVIGFLYQVWRTTIDLYYGPFDEFIPWGFLIKMAFLFLFIILILGYIDLLLSEFIVALMYKHRITATQAWSRFLNLHWSHLLQFLAFGLFWLILSIAAIIAVITVSVAMCCIGIILLIIPYINAVYLLPISYTFRAFSLEFLAQFGPEYSVFADNLESTTVVAG